MPADLDQIPDVLESVYPVVHAARSVRIDDDRVRAWARTLAPEALTVPTDDLLYHGPADRVANFVLISDALNFCFWSPRSWSVRYRGQTWTRTLAMLAGLLRTIEVDPSWLTADRWASATDAEVAEIFNDQGEIPLARRRREIMQETGQLLARRHGGQFAAMAESVDRDALRLARRLAEIFPSFRDVATYDGRPVAFLKRAQIAAADLHRAWLANGYPGLNNLQALTVFADYRLPQLFRHEGLLVLSDAFAARIDREEEIPAGSPEEVELRAATVVIARMLCDAVADAGHQAEQWALDYELWRRAKLPEVTVPHHRTVTEFY